MINTTKQRKKGNAVKLNDRFCSNGLHTKGEKKPTLRYNIEMKQSANSRKVVHLMKWRRHIGSYHKSLWWTLLLLLKEGNNALSKFDLLNGRLN